MVRLLEQHPTEKHKDLDCHPVTRVLFMALDDMGIERTRFNDWRLDVRKGFVQRNLEALPVQMLVNNRHDDLDEVQVDARSFLTQMNALTRACLGTAKQTGSIGEDMRRVIGRQDRLERKMDRFLELLESGTQKQGKDEVKRMACSDAMGSYKPGTPARLFVQFFVDSLLAHVLHHTQLKTKLWKALDSKERGKISTSFRFQKKCVRCVLCFCESFPSQPPTGASHCDWVTKLNSDAMAAEWRLLDHWNRKAGKAQSDKLTFSMIESVTFHELDESFNSMTLKGLKLADLEMLKRN